MSIKIKEMMDRPEVLLRGNFACAGCGLSVAYRTAISALERPIVVIPACCASVIQSLHPRVTYNVPTLNIAFAAHAAAASGISRAKKRRGEKVTTVVWSGDGGTYDIGVATWSGAAERNEDIIYVCLDNEAYMNTGIQRSSQTPVGTWTTSTPLGKAELKKDMPAIMAAHKIPYVATASASYPEDLVNKVIKARDMGKGFKYIHVHLPCPTGWRFAESLSITVGRLAVETGMWRLMESENGGKLRLNYKPEERKPVKDYLSVQGRFNPLKESDIEKLQKEVDEIFREFEG